MIRLTLTLDVAGQVRGAVHDGDRLVCQVEPGGDDSAAPPPSTLEWITVRLPGLATIDGPAPLVLILLRRLGIAVPPYADPGLAPTLAT